MIEVETPPDLAKHVGETRHSGWQAVTQEAIDEFARLTGDDHWIHVDRERAEKEMPGGRTIAHGLYLVGLIPMLQRQCYRIRVRGRGLNYGYDRIRFTAPVQRDTRIRLAITFDKVERVEKGTRILTTQVIERENEDRPAVVANHILLILDD